MLERDTNKTEGFTSSRHGGGINKYPGVGEPWLYVYTAVAGYHGQISTSKEDLCTDSH